LSLTLSLLSFGLTASRTAASFQDATQARFLGDACAEEALQQLHDNTSFVGSGSLSTGGGTCTYAISRAGNSRTIQAVGNKNGFVRRVSVSVTSVTPRLTIGAWSEVAAF